MPVHLVLRLPEMNVARSADRLSKLLTQPDNGAVKLPQVLLASGIAIAKHECIIAKRLNFQIIIKRGDAFQLIPILMVRHRPEQLPGLTGRADD